MSGQNGGVSQRISDLHATSRDVQRSSYTAHDTFLAALQELERSDDGAQGFRAFWTTAFNHGRREGVKSCARKDGSEHPEWRRVRSCIPYVPQIYPTSTNSAPAVYSTPADASPRVQSIRIHRQSSKSIQVSATPRLSFQESTVTGPQTHHGRPARVVVPARRWQNAFSSLQQRASRSQRSLRSTALYTSLPPRPLPSAPVNSRSQMVSGSSSHHHRGRTFQVMATMHLAAPNPYSTLPAFMPSHVHGPSGCAGGDPQLLRILLLRIGSYWLIGHGS
ncbi:hypothetical protein PLICRDRAFT_180299 [Plicaturopsis crispa FD-325 SS-3]|uniref:Uncharacterized protein n=1 Tax=Plicaturopsis crispa FD-325 SS-3 TaxID=944288 RepID=A0A0C9SKD0_PLICR|nr:hypothetical protein PLICRDRAFT_180299 [Plicaturopsis crispa FD-325 SS-3]